MKCVPTIVRRYNKITTMGTNTNKLIFIKVSPDFAVMEKSRIVIPNHFPKYDSYPINADLLYLLY